MKHLTLCYILFLTSLLHAWGQEIKIPEPINGRLIITKVPDIKEYGIPVRIEMDEDKIKFSYEKYGQYFENFDLPYNQISKIDKVNPLGIPNRLAIEEKNGKRYLLGTYKRNVIYNFLDQKVKLNEREVNSFEQKAWIKIVYFPFLYELYTAGVITLTKDTLSFKPFNNYDNFKEIKIPLNSIRIAKKRNYLLFIPQSIIIKTEENKKYKFAVQSRNLLLKQINKAINKP